LQFYRNNRELSADVKTAVKTELTRARNNYKTVFVNNYKDWLMYESNGSPRLNKIARRILFSYCPFSAPIRESLQLNPQYAESLKRFGIQNQKRVQYLSIIAQKISQTTKKLPKELLEEQEYTKS
jgi:hypothetical protein